MSAARPLPTPARPAATLRVVNHTAGEGYAPGQLPAVRAELLARAATECGHGRCGLRDDCTSACRLREAAQAVQAQIEAQLLQPDPLPPYARTVFWADSAPEPRAVPWGPAAGWPPAEPAGRYAWEDTPEARQLLAELDRDARLARWVVGLLLALLVGAIVLPGLVDWAARQGLL